MSLILDALRKSEQERRQMEASAGLPPLLDVASPPPRRHAPILPGAGIAVLGAAIVAALYWLNVERAAPPSRSAAPSSVADAAAGAPAAPAATAAEPARERVRAAGDAVRRENAAAQERVVRALAEEARVSSRRETEVAPAPAPAASAAPVRAPAPAVYAPAAVDEDVKLLRAMPPEFQRELPELAVTIHIYAPNPADRILYINNRPYRPGERVAEGVVVEEIVQDGAVLSYRGRRFKLPRPS